MKSKKLKDAGIIASEGRSLDSIYFSAVVVVATAIGYAVGIIIAIIIKSI